MRCPKCGEFFSFNWSSGEQNMLCPERDIIDFECQKCHHKFYAYGKTHYHSWTSYRLPIYEGPEGLQVTPHLCFEE